MKNAIRTDLIGLKYNKSHYIMSKNSCDYLKAIIDNKSVNQDSVQYYYNAVFEDNSFIANKTGYDGLVAKGLDIVKALV